MMAACCLLSNLDIAHSFFCVIQATCSTAYGITLWNVNAHFACFNSCFFTAFAVLGPEQNETGTEQNETERRSKMRIVSLMSILGCSGRGYERGMSYRMQGTALPEGNRSGLRCWRGIILQVVL